MGEELPCERELGNSHDPYVVAVSKTIGGERKVVGHVPRRILAISSLFIRRGGIILCEMMGNHRYSADLPQGGLEIPCALHFITDNDKEGKKAKDLFQSTLSVEVEEFLETTPQKLPVTMKLTSTTGELPRVTVDNEEAAEINVSKPVAVTKLPSGIANNEEASIIVNLTDIDPGVLSPLKKKVKNIDLERVIMGEELSEVKINFAQQLLKVQFPKINGLFCTLHQEKKLELTESSIQNKLQIVYCRSRHHWIVATTIKCSIGEVRVYDSIFQYCDEEAKYIIQNLFQ